MLSAGVGARRPADPPALHPHRVHEAEGRGRHAFALFQALRHPGPLIWILPAHAPHMPMLRGLPQGLGARLHLLRPAGEIDLLWCFEEALRSTAPALVEVCGDAGLVCDPHDADSLARLLGRLADEPGLREKMRQRGFARGRRFTWDAAAERLDGILQSVVSPRAVPMVGRPA